MTVTLGDLLPADSELSWWMLNRVALTDDLGFADKLLHDAIDSVDGTEVAAYRLVAARLYEGNRVVEEMDAHPVVRAFVDGMNTNARVSPAVELLRDRYPREPKAGGSRPTSRVHRTFDSARHLTVHYSTKPGERARMLRTAAPLPARAYVDHTHGAEGFRYLFAQDVVAAHLGPVNGPMNQESVTFAHRLLNAFAQLAIAAVRHYLEQRGIDPADIELVERATVPPSSGDAPPK